MAMRSTSGLRVEVGKDRVEVGSFDNVSYPDGLVNAPSAFLNGQAPVKPEWLYGRLNDILIQEEHRSFVEQVLSLGKCELVANKI
jgi:hypothetical protein